MCRGKVAIDLHYQLVGFSSVLLWTFCNCWRRCLIEITSMWSCFLITLRSGQKRLLCLTRKQKQLQQIVCCHGLPEELLSDRGANFLSTLVQDILGVKKNSYHHKMVEKFNSTVTDMIAKSCDICERDWDDYLPILFFAYQVSAQESTKESPFFLMHGSDPSLPTQTLLTFNRTPYAADMDDYKVDLCSSLSAAWKVNIQKSYYDKSSKASNVKPGDRVMVFMPAERQGKTWKLLHPYHGPYRVLSVTDTNVEVRLVDNPQGESMFVHLSRCCPQQRDTVWKGPRDKRCRQKRKNVD